MVIMLFLQDATSPADFVGMSPVGHDSQMSKNVYNVLLNPLSDMVMRVAMAAGVHNIVSKTRYFPLLPHAAIFRALDVDGLVLDFPGWFSYNYRNANQREVLPPRRGGLNVPVSKSRAWEGVTASHLIDIKKNFDEIDEIVEWG